VGGGLKYIISRYGTRSMDYRVHDALTPLMNLNPVPTCTARYST